MTVSTVDIKPGLRLCPPLPFGSVPMWTESIESQSYLLCCHEDVSFFTGIWGSAVYDCLLLCGSGDKRAFFFSFTKLIELHYTKDLVLWGFVGHPFVVVLFQENEAEKGQGSSDAWATSQIMWGCRC